mmetsp:Transcript_14311/g.26560  ORF Transcript_14311/g.26560 Transcript_14311/m.26560 type:complete len:234 (-) Transcript_14311:86-787(-)
MMSRLVFHCLLSVCLCLTTAIRSKPQRVFQAFMKGRTRTPLVWTAKREGVSQVLLVEWQGCPDCALYGEDLVESTLKPGLGKLMDLKVILAPGAHNLDDPDPNLHKWTACANEVVGSRDPSYGWYHVVSCAMGIDGTEAVSSCLDKAEQTASILKVKECMADASKSGELVTKMHSEYEDLNVRQFPWVKVNGVDLPPPDENGDKVVDLNKAVADYATSAGLALPEAMAGANAL